MSEVVELDAHTGTATRYGGGWEAYERERAAARERAQTDHDAAVAERERVAAIEREIRRRAEASRRRVNPRAAPDGDKHAARVGPRPGGRDGQPRAQGRRPRRAHRGAPTRRGATAPLSLTLTATERRGGRAVALEGAVLARGDWRLGPIDLAVHHGERVLLSGPNGSGKSTLLAALAGPHVAGRRACAASRRARSSPSSGRRATLLGGDDADRRRRAGADRPRTRPTRGRRWPPTGSRPRPRARARAHAVARRADARRAGGDRAAPRDVPAARRADQPPRRRVARGARGARSTAGPARSSSPPTTAACATHCASTGRSRSTVRLRP